MSIEAMKLALEALEYAGPSWAEARKPAADALRAAIEQAEKQEPVAWVYAYELKEDDGYVVCETTPQTEPGWIPLYTAPPQQPKQEPVAWLYNGNIHIFDPSDWAESSVTPLYNAPIQREWQGLTNEEVIALPHCCNETDSEVILFYRAIEARLKEKNA